MIRNVWHFVVKTSIVWKTAAAAGTSWEAAKMTGTTHPYFAPLAAILCLQVTVEESLSRGYQRVLGIIAGVVLADLTAHFIGIHGWSVALLVLIGTGLARWIHLGPQAVPQVGVSAMMVLTVGGGHYAYSWDRIIDTLIGAAVAIAINVFVIPPDFTEKAESRLEQSIAALTARFEKIAKWLDAGADLGDGRKLQDDVREYIHHLHEAVEDVKEALGALRYSPLVRRRRQRLMYYRDQLLHLRQGYAHAAGILRTLLEWQVSHALPDSHKRHWSEVCRAVATVVSNWGSRLSSMEQVPIEEIPDVLSRLLQNSSPEVRYEMSLYNDVLELLEDVAAPQNDALQKRFHVEQTVLE